jgi:hypothetical protein
VPVPRRIVGLDLGQSHDPSALVVLEGHASQDPQSGRPVEAYQMRHLERLPLNQPYPDYVAHVARLMATPELRRATLVIDYTGVGRPVYDMFASIRGLSPLGLLITGGVAVTHKGRIWHVPKRDLATAVLTLLQSQRLRVSRGLVESSILVKELLNFRVKVTLSGVDQYEAWREGDHDDYVLATACAAWVALHVPQAELYPRAGGRYALLDGPRARSGPQSDKPVRPQLGLSPGFPLPTSLASRGRALADPRSR